MSKSLGNGIDPLDLIEQYGADALRFSLVTGNTPGNDMRFYIERVEASRNFANKLWNASRFVLMHLDENAVDENQAISNLSQEDKWIISRINTVIKEVTENLRKYELGIAAQKIYDFTWNEYCDWYIEMVKPRLFSDDNKDKDTAKYVLLIVLRDILKLLHPFIPYITEEIWTYLPGKDKELIIEQWPLYNEERSYKDAEKSIDFIMESVKSIRNIRAEMNVVPSKKAKAIFVTSDADLNRILSTSERFFKTLASASEIQVTESKDNIGEDAMSTVVGNCTIFLPLEELVDMEKEIERLQKEKEKLEGEIKRVKSKLSNEGFVSKAPKQVIDQEREKEIKYQQMMEKVLERLDSLRNNR